MSMFKKITLGLTTLVLFSLFPLALNAQDDAAGGKAMTSVTGCLKQGTDAKGFYMMGQDGKMYEVMGKGLSEHVGHTITVTGSQVTLPQEMEEKKEQSEKTEAGGMAHVDMKVSSVKMVSASCQ